MVHDIEESLFHKCLYIFQFVSIFQLRQLRFYEGQSLGPDELVVLGIGSCFRHFYTAPAAEYGHQ